MESASGKLRIGELARRTGLTPAVLRAWEQRYAVIDPERTPGGTRLYSPADEARIREMQARIADGLAPADAARATIERGAAAFPSGRAEPAPPTSPDPATERRDTPVTGPSELQLAAEALSDALRRLDRDSAERALDRLLAGFAFELVARAVILPYLVDVGERWARNEASIAEEHLATHILRSRLLALTRGLGPGHQRRAVLACPPGEYHDIALVILAVALARRGWQITLLGADTPAATIADAARTIDADVVVVAATLPERLRSVHTPLRALAADRRLVLAGRGAGGLTKLPSGSHRLDGDPITAAEMIDTLTA